MIVPNYIPEPLEVPGNVTQEAYPLRLAFIRRVTLLHAASVVILILAANLNWPVVGWQWAAGSLAVCLGTLDLWRILRRGRPDEARVSVGTLPVVLLVAAWLVHELIALGIPIWSPLAGIACAMVYTLCCGRDYSFLGCWTLSLIASTVVNAAILSGEGSLGRTAALALGLNAAYLTYHVYDLASLMARRRRDEAAAAVVDLYRDVFNVFGYVVRCVGHWRKHRIWLAK